ncbi:MAG: hypothetical protein AAF443_08245 [Chlamydiota bacterium]
MAISLGNNVHTPPPLHQPLHQSKKTSEPSPQREKSPELPPSFIEMQGNILTYIWLRGNKTLDGLCNYINPWITQHASKSDSTKMIVEKFTKWSPTICNASLGLIGVHSIIYYPLTSLIGIVIGAALSANILRNDILTHPVLGQFGEHSWRAKATFLVIGYASYFSGSTLIATSTRIWLGINVGNIIIYNLIPWNKDKKYAVLSEEKIAKIQMFTQFAAHFINDQASQN